MNLVLNIKYIGEQQSNNAQLDPQAAITALLHALADWTLDPGLDLTNNPAFDPDPLRAPFRGPAWDGVNGQFDATKGAMHYSPRRPGYPDSPNAVRYVGRFIETKFAFCFDTDDAELISSLDEAIAANMQRPAYLAAASEVTRRRASASAKR